MSGSEDYLDGLLNSINKAKTDAVQVEEKAVQKQKEMVETRKAISPDDDFFEATGIDASETHLKTSHPYLRKVLSEDDFLRQFEEEISSKDTDLFIEEFESEINDEERVFQATGEIPDYEGTVESLLNDIDGKVKKAKKEMDAPKREEPKAIVPEPEESSEDDFGGLDELVSEDSPEPEPEAESVTEEAAGDDDIDGLDLDGLMDSIEEQEVTPIEEDDVEASGEDEDLGLSLDDAAADSDEEPIDDSLKEFMPDEMDALDAAEFGQDGEEPDLSGEGDLDLDNLLGEDEELMDIGDLLSGGEGEGSGEIDESAEGGEGDSETDSEEEEESGKKGKKKKKKKKEKGEKKPNPILQKIGLILFGPPDEEELAEMEAERLAKEAKESGMSEIQYDEDGNPIVIEDPKEAKKRAKEEKKKAKEEAKKEKAAAKKEAAEKKPKKEPKPKKEKKPKAPDNSPKIPLPIIATFLVLSISIIGVVMVGMTFTGQMRHMAQAQELFDAKEYMLAYEKLNGYALTDENDILMRNQARVLADVQQCQKEYESFIQYEQYDFALDALIKGLGRYEKYKDDAIEYGIADEYDAYGQGFVSELLDSFGLSKEDALNIYNQKNRHYYTIELRKVLIRLGMDD